MTTIQVSAATSPNGFVGWLRIGRGRWTAVVSGETYDDALDRLMTYTRERRLPHADLLVNTGDDPNRKPSRFVRTTDTTLDFVNVR